MSFFASFLLAATLTTAPASAPAPLQAPATSPAAPAAPASEGASYSASDLDTLRGKVGTEVEVTGTPRGTGRSKSGNVVYLNFAGAHKAVALVFFTGGAAGASGADTGAKKAQSEEDLKEFVGKSISVKGKLTDYKGDLQIVVNSLDQIKVVPTP